MGALVDFPLREARALLKQSGPNADSMTAEERTLAETARERLGGAISVEAGPGGSGQDAAIDLAESLVGHEVEVETTLGDTISGTLEGIVGYRSLTIRECSTFRRSVNASIIRSISLTQTTERRAA